MTDHALITTQAQPSALALAGQAANRAAAEGLFSDYRARKSENTRRRQDAGLSLLADFLNTAGIHGAPTGADLATDPAAWQGVTWGMVAGFARWLLGLGYAVGTVNVRLSTVKTYAGLAAQAGAIPAAELAMIRQVSGYSRQEARRIDETRERTRQGGKKSEPVSISRLQAEQLKWQPDTPQGRRDALIMALLLDHGLRVGELAGLTVDAVDLAAGELRFYRPKVDKTQTHRLTGDALRALRAYVAAGDIPAIGPLLRASRKGGTLTTAGMSERAITDRVRTLGAEIDLDGLSAHDCRHYWATTAARNKTPIDRLQDAGGWASPAMPLRYVEAAKIANEGVNV